MVIRLHNIITKIAQKLVISTDEKKIIIGVLFFKLFLFAFFGGFVSEMFPWDGLSEWFHVWSRWDARNFLIITEYGYNPPGFPVDVQAFLVHFMPAYPVILWLFSFGGHFSIEVVSVVVSIVCIVPASVVLYRLMLLEFSSREMALYAVVALTIFPTSYFTVAGYSESLFLLCTLGAFYLLRTHREQWAGLCVAIAILTRFIGITFIPIFVILFIVEYHRSRTIPLRVVLGGMYAIGAIVVYLILNHYFYGSWFFFLTEKISFNATKQWIFPFFESAYHLYLIVTQPSRWLDVVYMFGAGLNAIFTLGATGVMLLGAKKIPWQYFVYSLCSLLIFVSLSGGISNARYVFSLFPLYMIIAQVQNTIVLKVLFFTSVVTLAFFSALFVHGFWAF